MGSLSSSTQLKTTMKFLVLASCVALSAAQYGLVGHPNGAVVPVDEPAVAAARAIAAAPVYASAAPVYAAGYGYSGPLNLNTHLVGHPNGAIVPVAIAAPAIAAPAIAAPIAAVPAVGYGYSGP